MKSCWRLKADTSNSTTSSTNSSATSSSIPVKISRRPYHNPWRIAGRRVFRIYSQSLRPARGIWCRRLPNLKLELFQFLAIDNISMEEETCGIRNDPTKGRFDVDALVTRSQEDANIARIDGLETALESNQTLYGRVLRTSPEAQLACERAGRIAYARAQYSIYDEPQGHHIDPVTGKLPYSFEVGGADFHGALKIDADYVLTRDQAQNEQINQELSAATSIADLEGQISAFQQSTEGVRD